MANFTLDGANQKITDTNGNELLKFTETASAVNEVTVANAATGGKPLVSATGGDTDIDLELAGKGVGKIKFPNIANANVAGGSPLLFRLDIPDASGDTDVVMRHKVRVIDAWGLNTGIAADATGDTWQVKNSTNAITDAVMKTATVNALKRAAAISPTYHEINAGGTLRVTAVKTTNAAVIVYVLAIPVA